MRPLLVISIGIAALLSGGAASAAGSGKDSTGGKGAAPSGVSTGSAGDSAGSGSESRPQGRDSASGADAPAPKPWEVGAAWELHHLIRQEDLAGAGAYKNFNYFSGYARWDPSPDDRISLRVGLYEKLLADQGESGFRFEDIVASYTRRIPLPAQFTMRVSLSLSAPTSFYSQLAGVITSPRLSVSADRPLGKYVTVDARLSGGVNIVRYASAEGGAPNSKYSIGAAAGANVVMPFHEPLSAGISLFTGYVWFYDVGAPPPMSGYMGAVADSQYMSQPVQQSYGGEVYVKYALPAVGWFRSDFTLALAQGDPTLGFASVLHDGVQHVYPFSRQTAEVYGTLAARF